jgi:uncharacterized protein YuzB (UPF0349 family)
MAENQVLALETHFALWEQSRAASRPKDVDVFEYYCLEHYLRDWTKTDDELRSGLVGGGYDGGVDGMYFFIDGELVMDSTPERESATKTVVLPSNLDSQGLVV